MDSEDAEPVRVGGRCEFSWCTTEHGQTVHPDDEEHRSGGVALPVRVRRAGESGAGTATVVDVGLHRGLHDDQTWLSFDDGRTVRAEVSLAAAREVLRAVLADPDLDLELRTHA